MADLVYADLGAVPYAAAMRIQEELLRRVADAEDDDRAYVLLLEHDPPVITLGRNSRGEHVLASTERLAGLGIEVHRTSRGGDVTYHGPGQLVAYPVVRLGRRRRTLRRYVHDLEEILVRLVGRFGISAGRTAGMTGVWVGPKKVAAIGVAVKRWIAHHGLALNVSPDLAHFDLIVPCGISGGGVTSIQQVLRKPVSVNEVKAPLVELMADVLGFDRVCRADALACPATALAGLRDVGARSQDGDRSAPGEHRPTAGERRGPVLTVKAGILATVKAAVNHDRR